MPTKPTQTKTDWAELSGTDDWDALLNPTTNPLAKAEPESEPPHKTRSKDPELRRASGAETRAATSGIDIPGHMRDLINRLPRDLGADEIDDAEAARRADRDTDDEPRPPGTDLVTRQTLPSAVKNAVQVAGVRNPKWHTINNLPGYMARAIRAMGRGMFNMITDTPLEDILTIANVNGQGPNSEEELRAVAGWLRDNAEEVRALDFDYSQLMPGYDPEVKEFRTDGIRFHVVRDEMGHYIYAYPEQDAKEPGEGPRGLGNDRRRLQGPRNESKENKVYNLTDEIRKNIYLLESIQEQIDDAKELDELMEELAALEAYRGKASKERYMSPEKQKERMSKHSTLGPLLSKAPGGSNLISWLHKEMNLGSQASFDPKHPETGKYGSGIWGDTVKSARVMWEIIKNNPDNFIVFIGERGVAGMRPTKGYIEKQTARIRDYNPSKDKSLPYHYAIFTADSRKYVQDPEVITGTKSKRGGLPFAADVRNVNMLDAIKNEIGSISKAFAAFPAPAGEEGGQSVEREKIAQRAAAKAGPADTRSQQELVNAIWSKISPVVAKIANKTVLKINNRAKRLIDAGNFEAATKVSQAGEKLRQFLIALDRSGGTTTIPQEYSPTFVNVLRVACREFGGDWYNSEEFMSFLKSALTVGEELKFILDTFRNQLGGGEINPHNN